MTALEITHRASVLVEQAHLTASRFDALGKTFSADLTRGFARDLEAGAPSGLYEHWLREQAQRADKLERAL